MPFSRCNRYILLNNFNNIYILKIFLFLKILLFENRKILYRVQLSLRSTGGSFTVLEISWEKILEFLRCTSGGKRFPLRGDSSFRDALLYRESNAHRFACRKSIGPYPILNEKSILDRKTASLRSTARYKWRRVTTSISFTVEAAIIYNSYLVSTRDFWTRAYHTGETPSWSETFSLSLPVSWMQRRWLISVMKYTGS